MCVGYQVVYVGYKVVYIGYQVVCVGYQVVCVGYQVVYVCVLLNCNGAVSHDFYLLWKLGSFIRIINGDIY